MHPRYRNLAWDGVPDERVRVRNTGLNQVSRTRAERFPDRSVAGPADAIPGLYTRTLRRAKENQLEARSYLAAGVSTSFTLAYALVASHAEALYSGLFSSGCGMMNDA